MQVQYEENPDYPGVRLFRCEPLKANLTPTACARNVTNKSQIQCAKCPIGKVHVSECAPQPPAKREWTTLPYSGSEPAKACARCGTRTYRLLNKTLCASCYNRQRELRVGANAKGGIPRNAAATLHRAVCLVELKGDTLLLELEYCTGRTEAKQVIQCRWPRARLVDYEAQPARIGAGKQATEAPINEENLTRPGRQTSDHAHQPAVSHDSAASSEPPTPNGHCHASAPQSPSS